MASPELIAQTETLLAFLSKQFGVAFEIRGDYTQVVSELMSSENASLLLSRIPGGSENGRVVQSKVDTTQFRALISYEYAAFLLMQHFAELLNNFYPITDGNENNKSQMKWEPLCWKGLDQIATVVIQLPASGYINRERDTTYDPLVNDYLNKLKELGFKQQRIYHKRWDEVLVLFSNEGYQLLLNQFIPFETVKNAMVALPLDYTKDTDKQLIAIQKRFQELEDNFPGLSYSVDLRSLWLNKLVQIYYANHMLKDAWEYFKLLEETEKQTPEAQNTLHHIILSFYGEYCSQKDFIHEDGKTFNSLFLAMLRQWNKPDATIEFLLASHLLSVLEPDNPSLFMGNTEPLIVLLSECNERQIVEKLDVEQLIALVRFLQLNHVTTQKRCIEIYKLLAQVISKTTEPFYLMQMNEMVLESAFSYLIFQGGFDRTNCPDFKSLWREWCVKNDKAHNPNDSEEEAKVYILSEFTRLNNQNAPNQDITPPVTGTPSNTGMFKVNTGKEEGTDLSTFQCNMGNKPQ